ncbi:hypothetical protein BD408DRAFT_416702, partial [Parasitella parasitica]
IASNPSWVWKRVKRCIPQPEQLIPLLKKLFEDYGPIITDDIRKPLFDREAKRTAENILETVRLGHVSDP